MKAKIIIAIISFLIGGIISYIIYPHLLKFIIFNTIVLITGYLLGYFHSKQS